MEMNRIGRFTDGQILTAGEKALVVMLVAGVFGYWAGFKLSIPGDGVGMPVVAGAAAPAVASFTQPALAPASASSALGEHSSHAGAVRKGKVAREDPTISKF
jgi:hypothetical protein